jgi:RNA polymerase sigma factor (sigma-70 family)
MSEPDREKWTFLVAQIQAGDPAGQEGLYRAFATGLRMFLRHHLQNDSDADDRLHDIFIKAVSAIRLGQLREPERLAGFLRTIARRQIAAHIGRAVEERALAANVAERAAAAPAPDPEKLVIDRDQRERAAGILQSLPVLDREILIRFYWLGQDAEQICRELELTYTQFRLRKSRAKSRFAREIRRDQAKNQKKMTLV